MRHAEVRCAAVRNLRCLAFARDDAGQGELREFLQDEARRAFTATKTTRAVGEVQGVSHGGALLPDR